MTNRIAIIPRFNFIYFFSFLVLSFFSTPSFGQPDCLDVVKRIKKAQTIIFMPKAKTIVDSFTIFINYLEDQYETLPDTCRYWLASSYQWRSNFGYTKIGLSEEGLDDCLRALEIFEERRVDKFHKEKAYLHNTIGLYYQGLFDFDKALFHMRKAIDLFSDAVDKEPLLQREINNSIASLGMLYYNIGNAELSEKYSRAGLKARMEFKNTPYASPFEDFFIANSYYSLALVFNLKVENEEKDSQLYYQNHDSAFYYLDTCINILEPNSFFSAYSTNSKGILINFFLKGTDWMSEAYPEKINLANSYFNRLLKLLEDATPEQLALAKLAQSRIRRNQKKWDDALESVQQSFEYLIVNFKDQDLYTNPDLEQSFIVNKIYFLEGLKLKAGLLSQRYEARKSIRDLKQSLQTYLLATQLVDSIQLSLPYDFSVEIIKAKFADIYTEALAVANQLLLVTGDKKYLQTAFFLAEKSKSYTLKRSLKKKELMARLVAGSAEKILLIKEEQCLKKIATFEKRYTKTFKEDSILAGQYLDSLSNYKNLHYRVQNQIEIFYPQLYASQFEQKIATISEVQNSLDDNSVYIEYVVSPKDLYIFLITNKVETTRLIRRSKTKEWDTLLSNCIGSLSDTIIQHEIYLSSAKKLYNVLLKEGLAHLENQKIEHLIIIPDDKLRSLPFEALLEKEPNANQPYKDLSYVLKKYSISYDFSISTNIYNRKKGKHIFENSICGFTADYLNEKGASTQRRCSNKRLEGAEIVVDSIEMIFSKNHINKRTTREEFLRESSLGRIVYIGTHGCIDYVNPLLSNILFTSTGDTLNSELSIIEIYNLNIKAEHVILTACYAGSGELIKGEGLISLARAFYYAGSNSLMTSLWSVEDIASTGIEIQYMKNLQRSDISKDRALQLAKLKYLEKNDEHPHVWANFVLFGNTAALN